MRVDFTDSISGGLSRNARQYSALSVSAYYQAIFSQQPLFKDTSREITLIKVQLTIYYN